MSADHHSKVPDDHTVPIVCPNCKRESFSPLLPDYPNEHRCGICGHQTLGYGIALHIIKRKTQREEAIWEAMIDADPDRMMEIAQTVKVTDPVELRKIIQREKARILPGGWDRRDKEIQEVLRTETDPEKLRQILLEMSRVKSEKLRHLPPSESPTPERSAVKPYKSPLKELIRRGLAWNRKFTNAELFEWMDEHAPEKVKAKYRTKHNEHGLLSHSREKQLKAIEKAISKVRADLNLPAPR